MCIRDRCELEGANEHQVEESQKAVAKMEVIIGDPDRLRAVAEDFIKHYETRVAEGATAVSYTHLDVYKRQDSKCFRCIIGYGSYRCSGNGIYSQELNAE